MNLKKKKMVAGVIATSIVAPITMNISYADENNIQTISIEYRTITANAVNFRTGPSTSYASMGKLNNGYKVEYIGMSGSWVNVKYNGKVGYVHGDYVSKSNGSSSNTAVKSTKVVTANSVNFRTGPSTSYSSMGKLNKGTEVGFISESNGWSKISYNGKVGYMSSQYLSNKTNTPSTDNSDTVVKSTKVVSASAVNFRTGPSTSYSKIATLSKGTEVGFISESNGWSKISYNGKVGYMASEYLANKTNAPSTGNSDNTVKSTKIVTASAVNFRTGPGTNYSKISTLSYGTEVGFISQSNGWSKISYNGKVGYMSSQYLGDKVSSNLPSSEKADKVIAFAKTLLGKPYVWGAEGPSSFDCSGFTQYVMKKSVGVSIPRVSRDQSKFGQYVNRNELKKGDLVFFDTDGANNGYVTHVGIYMGNDDLIHASSGDKKVVISKLSSSYYTKAYVNARRVL